MTERRWWRAGSLRTRLLVLSAPVAIVVIVVLLKAWTVVVAGGAAATDFAARDGDALRSYVATLGVLDVAPARSHFAAGTLAVLDDDLTEADAQFSEALAHTDGPQSCSVRVNLELVRETLGDRAAAEFDAAAVDWYRRALTLVDDAPGGCFTGSTDADQGRRAVLDATVGRLNAKLDAASVPPPPPPPPPPAAPPPPPPPPASGSAPVTPEDRLRLNPGVGDPLDRLQQILRDAAAAQNGG